MFAPKEWQQHRIARLVVQRLFGMATVKRIAVLDFVFHPDTNSTREMPAISICVDLLEQASQLAIFDPKVPKVQIAAELAEPALDPPIGGGLSGDGIWQQVDLLMAVCASADAVLILTEWAKFPELVLCKLAAEMRHQAWLFEARAIDIAEMARVAGLRVWRLGGR